ncbi:MAG: hypothetical protein LBV77_00600 [Candidatus Adiutrix intracellularis]|nr:hypothetical protein [Candidatus Adiutrix intracellularis]
MLKPTQHQTRPLYLPTTTGSSKLAAIVSGNFSIRRVPPLTANKTPAPAIASTSHEILKPAPKT